ncbi:MAG: hypothetical protein HY067_07950 [Betaproteobacteria bacterium]|nr:hypothetical protein [Betaproteobacteria bacterium]
MSERVLACLVLLFSDKAVTKHFACQQPEFAASDCCDAKIFLPLDQKDKPQFRQWSGAPAMLQSGSPMFSDAKQKSRVGQAATGLK